MTWLITGGAGFIGAHVTETLHKAGRSVVVLDDLSTGDSSRVADSIPFVEISLQQHSELEQFFSDNNFLGVVHLAAKKSVSESIERPDYYWKQNVDGIRNLLTAMTNNGVKNFVYSSSAAVYGQPDIESGALISEKLPCNPINPYGSTKLEGEVLSRIIAEEQGLKILALRYFNVAGAGRPSLGDQYIFNLIPIIFDAIERGEQPIVFGDDYPTPDGSCIRDYVHVQDLADAHLAAVDYVEKSDAGFIPVNIGTGLGASVYDVISMIGEVTGLPIDPIVGRRRIGDPAALVADVSLAKKVLGWESSRDLREIVASAWDAWEFGHK